MTAAEPSTPKSSSMSFPGRPPLDNARNPCTTWSGRAAVEDHGGGVGDPGHLDESDGSVEVDSGIIGLDTQADALDRSAMCVAGDLGQHQRHHHPAIASSRKA